MKIINTETKQVDNVNDKQALRVIKRTDGLWQEYREPAPVPVAAPKTAAPKKRMVVKKKSIRKKRKTK